MLIVLSIMAALSLAVATVYSGMSWERGRHWKDQKASSQDFLVFLVLLLTTIIVFATL